MDKNIKIALLIITALVGLYYFISPYENCIRNYKSQFSEEWDKVEVSSFAMHYCKGHSW